MPSELGPVAVIGAGPAGLTAAYLLSKAGVHATVLEADPLYVGGISRTVQHRGYGFDIGGHRFFSKSQAVEELWTELLPKDLLERPRSSRVYYDGKFFSYPLKPLEALRTLGPVEAARCVASYAAARLRPVPAPANFEEWVVNQFGRRLFEIFFKTYTEKVWGMPCREISADWAAQRIKGLSLGSAVLSALRPRRPEQAVIKTLIDSFRYPRRGPGMLWEAAATQIRALGGEVRLGRTVTRCAYEGPSDGWVVTHEGAADEQRLHARHVISTAPLGRLPALLAPAPSEATLGAAQQLRYRDFLIVVLMARASDTFTDNWVYIQDPRVKVGRVQNFKSWSPELVPEPGCASYGCEYFCQEGDGLWASSDADLIALAKRELQWLGLVDGATVFDAVVVRQPKAYPVYDEHYTRHVEVIRRDLAERYPTLDVVGRNGMHKYNNQDHSMMTAMLCVDNLLSGERRWDLWRVNQDAEYHEAGSAGADEGGRAVPRAVGTRA